MNRTILNQLKEWKTHPKRKPLLLMGARQVGKTYILEAFARAEYQNHIYLNFEDTPSLCSLFSGSLAPKELIRVLSIEKNVDIDPETTLILFDEVQECPEALNSLKYFYEDARHYHVCAAGSLLGVKLAHTKGFPVGKVDFLHLYPLSFIEFLNAINETKLKSYLEEIKTIEPLPDILHEKLLHYFKIYLLIGGMPEVVAEYAESENLTKIREIQQALLNAYRLDFAKHAPKDQVMRINQVWDCIPAQLAKENKKFIYSIIRKGARAKEFEIAIQWLTEAGLIYKTYNITTPKMPLNAYANFEAFKTYLVDVGLLGAMTNLSTKAVIHGDQLFQEFRGSLVENYVAQVLAGLNKGLYYWSSEGKAELDFVIQSDNHISPVEVKSGASSKKRSLLVYAEKCKAPLLIRSSPMNLKQDGLVLNIPLYLMHDIDKLIELSSKEPARS